MLDVDCGQRESRTPRRIRRGGRIADQHDAILRWGLDPAIGALEFGERPRRLTPGDVIRIGNTDLRFET